MGIYFLIDYISNKYKNRKRTKKRTTGEPAMAYVFEACERMRDIPSAETDEFYTNWIKVENEF